MKELELYVVYENPLDAPGQFVVRKWILDKPTDEIHTEPTLTAVREHIPQGLVNIGRQPNDDPKIVEVWI